MQIEDYNNEALRRVKAFGTYLTNILDSKLPFERREKAVKLALDLFFNEDILFYDSILVHDNKEKRSFFVLQSFLYDLLKSDFRNMEFSWNSYHSSENFNLKNGLKKVSLQQSVTFSNYPPAQINYKTQKKIETYLTLQTKYIYSNPETLFTVKLKHIMYE